jgi:hypothetical protein
VHVLREDSLRSIRCASAAALVLKEGFPENPVAVPVVGTTGFVLEAQRGARRPDPRASPIHFTPLPYQLARLS